MASKPTASQQTTNWWTTLPGVLAGLAAVIAAVSGLVVVFKEDPASPTVQAKPTEPAVPQAPPAPVAVPAPAPAAASAPAADTGQSVQLRDVGAGASVDIQQNQ